MLYDIFSKALDAISQFLGSKFPILMTFCLIIGILCIVAGISMIFGKKKKIGEAIMLFLLGIGLISIRYCFGAPILGIGGLHMGISH